MAKYHLRENGEPGLCRASSKPCPLGAGPEEHYGTKAEARQAFELVMELEALFQRAHGELGVAGKLTPQTARLIQEKEEAWRQVEPGGEVSVYRGQLLTLLESDKAPPTPRWRDFTLQREEARLEISHLDGRPAGLIVSTGENWEAFTGSGAPLGVGETEERALQLLASHVEEEQAPTYHMAHQPDPEGAQGFEVDKMLPDYYDHPEWYSSGSKADRESVRALSLIRGKPQAEVTIYRALPKVEYGIEPGNWVTLSRTYAEDHALQYDGEEWPVISMKVKASEIRTPGDDINEWGYYPN